MTVLNDRAHALPKPTRESLSSMSKQLQRRSFTQVMIQMQHSGLIWHPPLLSEQVENDYADALALTGKQLFQNLVHIPTGEELVWFNQRLQQNWQQITCHNQTTQYFSRS